MKNYGDLGGFYPPGPTASFSIVFISQSASFINCSLLLLLLLLLYIWKLYWICCFANHFTNMFHRNMIAYILKQLTTLSTLVSSVLNSDDSLSSNVLFHTSLVIVMLTFRIWQLLPVFARKKMMMMMMKKKHRKCLYEIALKHIKQAF